MARLNLLKLGHLALGLRTHEGAPARHISPELQLRRSVLACLLWENQFYEDGVEIAGRIVARVTCQCYEWHDNRGADTISFSRSLTHSSIFSFRAARAWRSVSNAASCASNRLASILLWTCDGPASPLG
jgi:hypothetical protein